MVKAGAIHQTRYFVFKNSHMQQMRHSWLTIGHCWACQNTFWDYMKEIKIVEYEESLFVNKDRCMHRQHWKASSINSRCLTLFYMNMPYLYDGSFYVLESGEVAHDTNMAAIPILELQRHDGSLYYYDWSRKWKSNLIKQPVCRLDSSAETHISLPYIQSDN